MKIHFDTDIGGDIDDLCALALLLGWPGVELVGVTTVLEEGGKRAGYARYALDLVGRRDVPVAAGAEVSLGCFRESEYGVPLEERYWPEPVSAAPGPLEAALDLLQRSIEDGAVIVPVGPVTNLALLEERSPGVLASAPLVIMGGLIDPLPPGYPPWDYKRDFNLQSDAAAALRVLESCDPTRTTLVPIEATVRTALRAPDIDGLRAAGGPLQRLLARQADAYAEDERYAERFAEYEGLPGDLVNFQHDPLAVAVALGWSGVLNQVVPLHIAVEEGWLRLRRDARGRPFNVTTGVDSRDFATMWLEAVTRV